MRYLILILLATVSIGTMSAQKTKMITVNFKYQFIHEGEGGTINTRLKVYVDGNVKAVSLPKLESEQNHVTIEIPTGQHKIRAVIESEYENTWEEHTIVNEYSIDCIYETDENFTKNTRVDLIFDLEKGTIVKKVDAQKGPFVNPF